MFKRLITVALVFGMAALAPPAAAQNCAPRELITRRLSADFQEQLKAGGLQVRQNVETLLEIWASSESGSFTVLISLPTGISCILAAGENFFVLSEKPEPPDAQS